MRQCWSARNRSGFASVGSVVAYNRLHVSGIEVCFQHVKEFVSASLLSKQNDSPAETPLFSLVPSPLPDFLHSCEWEWPGNEATPASLWFDWWPTHKSVSSCPGWTTLSKYGLPCMLITLEVQGASSTNRQILIPVVVDKDNN